MRHRVALVPLALAALSALLIPSSPAGAALPGFQVRLNAPAEFKAGAEPRVVEAVVATNAGRRCQKVRWSMLLKVQGVSFDDVKVTRIENGGEFPLQSQVRGDTARLTDVNVDPGVLCRDQTVTARYDISFSADAPQGAVVYQIQALNVAGQVLEQSEAQSRVAGGAPAAEPTRTASPEPSPTESEAVQDPPPPSDEPSESDAAAAPATEPTIAANPASSSSGVPTLLGPGLIVGALFVLAGVALLMRLRLRNRKPEPAHGLPTGFYPTH